MFEKWIASITLFFQQLAEFQLGGSQPSQPIPIPIKEQPTQRR